MQSVSDNDIWKRRLEEPLIELAAVSVFRLGRCYMPARHSRSLGQGPEKHGYRRLMTCRWH